MKVARLGMKVATPPLTNHQPVTTLDYNQIIQGHASFLHFVFENGQNIKKQQLAM